MKKIIILLLSIVVSFNSFGQDSNLSGKKLFKMAKEYGRMGDSIKAGEYIKLSAEKGYPEAMGWLGDMYVAGRLGVAENLHLAEDWYEKGVKAGDGYCYWKLGFIYYMEMISHEDVGDIDLKKDNKKKGWEMIQNAARFGVVEARKFMDLIEYEQMKGGSRHGTTMWGYYSY